MGDASSSIKVTPDKLGRVYRSQLAGSNRPYEVDVSGVAVDTWTANTSIAASALLRPTDAKQTGFIYRNSASAGQTGSSEPAWPTSQGSTVNDGSLTLTAAIPPAGGEDAIASVTWAQQSPPDGALTITDQVNTSLVSAAYLGGGTSGNVYVVNVTITMVSTAIHVAQIVLTIL